MSFTALLDKKCSWTRKAGVASSTLGEQIVTHTTIASGVKCRVEPDPYVREGIHEIATEFEKYYEKMYMDYRTDILFGDIVTIVGNPIKRVVDKVDDGGGHSHHLEVSLWYTKPQ